MTSREQQTELMTTKPTLREVVLQYGTVAHLKELDTLLAAASSVEPQPTGLLQTCFDQAITDLMNATNAGEQVEPVRELYRVWREVYTSSSVEPSAPQEIKDHCAELIGHTIPDAVETEPRMTDDMIDDMLKCAEESYHQARTDYLRIGGSASMAADCGAAARAETIRSYLHQAGVVKAVVADDASGSEKEPS